MSQHGETTTPDDSIPPTEPSHAPRVDEVQEADDDNIGNRIAPAVKSHADEDEDDGPQPGNAIPDDATPPDVGNSLATPPVAAQAPREPGAPGTGRKRNRGKGRGARPGAPGGGGGGGGEHRGGDEPRRSDPQQHRAFHVGDKVRARIVVVGQGGVLCDLWGKERGVLDMRELAHDNPDPKVGDSVDIIVLQDGARGGNLVVTRDPSRAEKSRELIAQAVNSGEPVEGLITGLNKGGLEVDVAGTRAFCPSSHIDIRVPSQQELLAMVLRRELFRVVQVTDNGREAVVSRRALREADVRVRAEQAITKFAVGDRVKGIVVAVKEHGIFVDLGGVEGRIQLTEISHDRSARPSDIAKVGDEIEALVVRIDIPPAQAPREEHDGDKHEGAPHADAHAEAAPHAEGEGQPEAAPHAEGEGQPEAAHADGEAGDKQPEAPHGDKGHGDRKHDKHGKKPRFSRLPEGTPRVELSRRAIEPDPWSDVNKRYPPGSVHKGKVARMQPFGAFIELERGVDGLLHVSEIGEKRIQHPNEVLAEGQEVNVRVTRIDPKQRRIGLAMLPEGVTAEQLKQSVNPRAGMVVMAKVIEHDNIGVWAQVEGVFGKQGRGLILPMDSNQPKGTDLRKAIPLGADVKVKIVELDRGRMRLSIRAAHLDEERQAYRAYQQQANATVVGTSLADKLKKLNLGR